MAKVRFNINICILIHKQLLSLAQLHCVSVPHNYAGQAIIDLQHVLIEFLDKKFERASFLKQKYAI